ncbi:MAG: citrate synthase [Gammaproteobacteria bacterium]|nr:citrate synthase [Gammaproteobacteria bacterium]
MSETKSSSKVSLRKEAFADRISTEIWQEIPASDNPYVATDARCHGYDLLDLVRHRSFIDVLYLLFRSELPNSGQSKLLESLFIGLINPGPRHPATQAAMNAGVSKVDYAHILPIALSIQGGSYLGGKEVELAMRFLVEHVQSSAREVAAALMRTYRPRPQGDNHIAPGFGSRYGDIDILCQKIALELLKLPAAGVTMKWAQEFVEELGCVGQGWLSPGIAAAVLTDLGFKPSAGVGLFQLISAPGLLAHGVEMAGRPLTAIPFIDQEHYVIDELTPR